MYLPKHFAGKDEMRILESIESYSFATLMSFDDQSRNDDMSRAVRDLMIGLETERKAMESEVPLT